MSKQGFNKTQGSWLQSFQKTEVTKQVVCCMYETTGNCMVAHLNISHMWHLSQLLKREKRDLCFRMKSSNWFWPLASGSCYYTIFKRESKNNLAVQGSLAPIAFYHSAAFGHNLCDNKYISLEEVSTVSGPRSLTYF